MTEKAVTIFFLLFSAAYLCAARELSFGAIYAPKAGFLPTLTGVVATMLAAVILAQEFWRGQPGRSRPVNWRKLIFIIAGLIVYLLLLSISGYIVATFVISLYLLKITDTAGWIMPLSLASAVAACFYLVFVRLLGINLP